MDVLLFAAVVGGLYGCLMFFDMFFKSCMHYPYEAFLAGTGLTVRPLRLHWHTTALNRTVFKWSSKYPRLLAASFDAGVWASIVLLPCTVIAHFVWTFFVQTSAVATASATAAGSTATGFGGAAAATASGSAAGIELMLPGVNLPLDEIGYYIVALGVCSVVHELGHAAAAVLSDVPVCAFGLHLFVVFPVAYTELATDRLQALRLRAKLRVLCAGIWHNLLLAAVAWATLATLGPLLLRPWFECAGGGVVVTHVDRGSPVRGGARGLRVGDVLTAVNGCAVGDREAWFRCLLRAIRQPPAYCVRSEYVHEHDESVHHQANEAAANSEQHCCDPAAPANVCFEQQSPLAGGDEEVDNQLAEIPQHVCLNARRAIEAARGFCNDDGGHACADSFCVRPLLANGTTIMQIRRRQVPPSVDGDASTTTAPTPPVADVIYLGHPADITSTVRVSAFLPKTAWFQPAWADAVALQLRYVVVFSLGLAFVNVLPVWAFDGQHIVAALAGDGLKRWMPERRRRELVAFGVTAVGTVVFGAGLVKVAWATWTR